MANLPIKP